MLGVLQVLQKTAILEYEKMPSKICVMHDITPTSLHSKACVMHDVKSCICTVLYMIDLWWLRTGIWGFRVSASVKLQSHFYYFLKYVSVSAFGSPGCFLSKVETLSKRGESGWKLCGRVFLPFFWAVICPANTENNGWHIHFPLSQVPF